jgi:hypothetical protein
MINRQPPSQPVNSRQTNTSRGSSDQEYEKLVRQVAERVWQLWQEDLRLMRERRGLKRGR